MEIILALLVAGGIAALAYAYRSQGTSYTPQEIKLIVQQDEDGRWRVVPAEGLPAAPTVRPGDTVTWVTRGTGAAFQMPYNDLFEELFEERTWTFDLRDGEDRTFRVADRTKVQEHVYAVYTREGRAYAHGESPPRMIFDTSEKQVSSSDVP